MVQTVLISEPHSAEHLVCHCGYAPGVLAGADLGGSQGEAEIALRRRVGSRLRSRLHSRHLARQFGQQLLHRLEGANRAAELLALARIDQARIEGPLGRAGHLLHPHQRRKGHDVARPQIGLPRPRQGQFRHLQPAARLAGGVITGAFGLLRLEQHDPQGAAMPSTCPSQGTARTSPLTRLPSDER